MANQQGQQAAGEGGKSIQKQAGNIPVRRESGRPLGLGRREEWWPELFAGSPFSLMRRMMEDMDRLFGGFGTERELAGGRALAWTPRVDVFERNGQFIIRADLPGMTKEDVKVDVTEDAIVLQGERRYEHEEDREGLYRAERSYGTFYRAIPLPEGVKADDAKATFSNGVLEVCLKAPETKSGQRRVEIKEGALTPDASTTGSTTRH